MLLTTEVGLTKLQLLEIGAEWEKREQWERGKAWAARIRLKSPKGTVSLMEIICYCEIIPIVSSQVSTS